MVKLNLSTSARTGTSGISHRVCVCMCVSWQLSGFDSAISSSQRLVVLLFLRSSLPEVLLINVFVAVGG